MLMDFVYNIFYVHSCLHVHKHMYIRMHILSFFFSFILSFFFECFPYSPNLSLLFFTIFQIVLHNICTFASVGYSKITASIGFGTIANKSGSKPYTSISDHFFGTPNLWRNYKNRDIINFCAILRNMSF